MTDDAQLLERITFNPGIYGGKPIIRGQRMAVEHVLGMLKAGSSYEELLEAYPWLERQDILACIAYALQSIEGERIVPIRMDTPA